MSYFAFGISYIYLHREEEMVSYFVQISCMLLSKAFNRFLKSSLLRSRFLLVETSLDALDEPFSVGQRNHANCD